MSDLGFCLLDLVLPSLSLFFPVHNLCFLSLPVEILLFTSVFCLLMGVLVRVSSTVMKHHNKNVCGEEKGLFGLFFSIAVPH